jgi:hypothetical protein
MAQLAPAERKALIAQYVDSAKINWAHIGIAALIKHGFIDRVLTTNFDPLVVRACAMIGEFPAVYDFAASQRFQPADVADKAIFHLHGQRTGFVLLITRIRFALFSKMQVGDGFGSWWDTAVRTTRCSNCLHRNRGSITTCSG